MEDKNSESKKTYSKIDSNSIFSNENINMGHQPELDYLKALTVFLLILIHVYISISEGYLKTFLTHSSIIISAGGIMFMMGIGMKYSRHLDLKYYFYRGFVLLTISQLFNFIRDCLPYLIAWWVKEDKIYLSRALLIIQTDIFTFAGFAFFLMAILKKMKLSDKSILIFGILMNWVTYRLFKIMKSPSNFLLSQFLGFFVLTNAEAYFPLCSYFIFVAIGHWMGGIYQKISNKDKFYNRILIFCFPMATIYHYVRCNYHIPLLPKFNTIEHYSLSPGPDAIFRVMNNMVLLAIFYKIHKILGKTPYFISHCGKNLNQYYIISYIATAQVSTFLVVTRGEKLTSEWKYSDLFSFMLMFLCRILIEMNDKYIHFTITNLKNQMRNIVFSLIWIITIICVVYIYPNIDEYATYWNDYLSQ